MAAKLVLSAGVRVRVCSGRGTTGQRKARVLGVGVEGYL